MSDLRLSIMKSSHDYGYHVRGIEVVVSTSVTDRDGEEADDMSADICVDDYSGRVYASISHVPRQPITRSVLLEIAEAFQEFARIAGEMEDAIKNIDPNVILECKTEMDDVDKEYSAVYQQIRERKDAIRDKRMGAYRAALSDKDYGVYEYGKRKPDAAAPHDPTAGA